MRFGFVRKSSFAKLSNHSQFSLTLENLEDRTLLSASYLQEPVIPSIDTRMQANLQSIYRLGLDLGNRPDVFMKVGDSNSYSGYFLDPLGNLAQAFANGSSLGAYAPLANTLGYFLIQAVDASGANSFTRTSVSTFGGWTSTDLLTPGKRGANPGSPQFALDSPLADEVQELRPSMALVMIGTNDVLTVSPTQYYTNISQIVHYLASQGVIPILTAIPSINLPGYPTLPGLVEQFDQILADVAAANEIPFFNLKVALDQLPNDGLGPDQVHLSDSPNGAGANSPADLAFGMNMRNLLTVEALGKVLNVVFQNGPADVASNPVSVAERTPLIDSLYQSILMRGSDSAGFAAFSQELNEGIAVEDIVAQLWTSTEHRALQIDQFYQQFLHRSADEGGMQWWLQAFAIGADEVAVKAAILSSSEYLNAHPTPELLVQELFQDALQRDASSADVSLWAARVEAFGEVPAIQEILLSPEAQGVVVNQYYVEFLGRTADASVGQNALALLGDHFVGDLPLVETLLSSAEFIDHLNGASTTI